MQAGVELGAHGVTHSILTKIPLALAAYEIQESKDVLEKHFGVPIRWFSFPNGNCVDLSPGIIRKLRENGFLGAVTLIPGTVSVGDDCFKLNRVAVDGLDSVSILATRLAGLWPVGRQNRGQF